MKFIRESLDGVEIHIRATPNARVEKIDGFENRDDGNQYLKVKIRAIPEDGAANESIIKIIAKALKIPKSDIELKSGQKGRIKCLLVKNKNLDIEAIIKALLPK